MANYQETKISIWPLFVAREISNVTCLYELINKTRPPSTVSEV